MALVVQLCMVAGAAAYPFLAPDEARQAGIVYDMWAAKQYLMPRVNGFPVLDGAPLHYWISIGFLSLFGPHEWVLRLPSAIAAGVLLVVFARSFLPDSMKRLPTLAAVLAVFLLQPALLFAGRFSSPDMLHLLLLTLALSCFLQASRRFEEGGWSARWTLAAWVSTAVFGLAAGPLAVLLPLLTVVLWLSMRRRFDIMAALCWWPGAPILVLLLLPWLLLANAYYPGIIVALLQEQALALWGGGIHGWAQPGHEPVWLLMLAGGLPLAVCLYRYRDPVRRAALDTATARLMAAWLIVLMPLHPLMTWTVAGHSLVMVMPLLYFAVMALLPVKGAVGNPSVYPWLLLGAVAVVIGLSGAYFFMQRVNHIYPVTQAISQRYNAATDKTIMLDRFDYAFNFYIGSPKLVYVATDWDTPQSDEQPRWKRALLRSARFVPETARSMLLTTHPAAGPTAPLPAYDDLLQRLCGRRMVNLWVIASDDAVQRYPVLGELKRIAGTGHVSAWFLSSGREPAHCVTWALRP